MAHRFTIALTLFELAILGLLYWGSSLEVVIFQDREQIGPSKKGRSQHRTSLLLEPRYFKLDHKGPWLQLRARSLTLDQERGDATFQRPQSTFFDPSGRPLSQISAEQIRYDGQRGSFHAQGNVNSKSWGPSGGQVVMRSQFAQGRPREGYLRSWGQVRGQVVRKRSFEQGLHFSSNEIRLELGKQVLRLQGDVALKRRNLEIQARRGEIYLANRNKKLKYYVLSDDVRLKETGAGPGREGYGEKLEGYVKERKLVLSGSPRVVQKRNVIRGRLITLYEDTDVVQVDDSATTLIMEK